MEHLKDIDERMKMVREALEGARENTSILMALNYQAYVEDGYAIEYIDKALAEIRGGA